MKKVTIDTCVLPADRLIKQAKDKGYDVAIVSVTERELAVGDKRLQVPGLRMVFEAGVIGESEIGKCVVGGNDNCWENILEVISSGSFPKVGARAQLTKGQRRQLRDAMILETHARERRDIFVTVDEKGFIKEGRRKKLEKLLGTRILTLHEFLKEIQS